MSADRVSRRDIFRTAAPKAPRAPTRKPSPSGQAAYQQAVQRHAAYRQQQIQAATQVAQRVQQQMHPNSTALGELDIRTDPQGAYDDLRNNLLALRGEGSEDKLKSGIGKHESSLRWIAGSLRPAAMKPNDDGKFTVGTEAFTQMMLRSLQQRYKGADIALVAISREGEKIGETGNPMLSPDTVLKQGTGTVIEVRPKNSDKPLYFKPDLSSILPGHTLADFGSPAKFERIRKVIESNPDLLEDWNQAYRTLVPPRTDGKGALPPGQDTAQATLDSLDPKKRDHVMAMLAAVVSMKPRRQIDFLNAAEQVVGEGGLLKPRDPVDPAKMVAHVFVNELAAGRTPETVKGAASIEPINIGKEFKHYKEDRRAQDFAQADFVRFREDFGDEVRDIGQIELPNPDGTPITNPDGSPLSNEQKLAVVLFNAYGGELQQTPENPLGVPEDFMQQMKPTIDQVIKVGGPSPRVSIVPVHVNAEGQRGPYLEPVIRVTGKQRSITGVESEQEMFVDTLGRSYSSWNDWRKNNQLPPGRMTFPKDGKLGTGPGLVTAESGATPMTRDNWKEHALHWADQAMRYGMVPMMALMVVPPLAMPMLGARAAFLAASAARAGSAARAATLAGRASRINSAMQLVGKTPMTMMGAFAGMSAYGAGRVGQQMLDRRAHGGAMNPFNDSVARSLWLQFGAAAGGVVGIGGFVYAQSLIRASMGQKTLLASRYTGTTTAFDRGVRLESYAATSFNVTWGPSLWDQYQMHKKEWGYLEPIDKLNFFASIGMFVGFTGWQAKRYGMKSFVWPKWYESAARRVYGDMGMGAAPKFTEQDVSAARKVLGLEKDFTAEDLKSAFRKMSKVTHPDVEGGSASAFQEVHAAQSLLTMHLEQSAGTAPRTGFQQNAPKPKRGAKGSSKNLPVPRNKG